MVGTADSSQSLIPLQSSQQWIPSPDATMEILTVLLVLSPYLATPVFCLSLDSRSFLETELTLFCDFTDTLRSRELYSRLAVLCVDVMTSEEHRHSDDITRLAINCAPYFVLQQQMVCTAPPHRVQGRHQARYVGHAHQV
jgi:hypothetical protein